MFALNWTRELITNDGLEAMAPLPATRPLDVAPHALAPIAGAAGGVIAAALILLTGAMATPLTLALGGTAALLYLGTAMVSGQRGAALLDLGAAATAAGVAMLAAGPPASALLVHAVWGILRGAQPAAAPGRRFAASWAAFHASAALLLGVGA